MTEFNQRSSAVAALVRRTHQPVQIASHGRVVLELRPAPAADSDSSPYQRAVASGQIRSARKRGPIPDGVLVPINQSPDLDAILAEVNGDAI